MKIAIIDLETTGLDPKKHEIIEVGCVVFNDKNFKIIDSFEVKVRPTHPETGDEKAFITNGYTEEKWKDAHSLTYAMKLLNILTKDAIFCSNNIVFDWNFLEIASELTQIDCAFHYKRIDIFTMAWVKIPHDKMTSWRLKAMCQYLNIEPEPDIHTALNGAMKAYEVYKKLMK